MSLAPSSLGHPASKGKQRLTHFSRNGNQPTSPIVLSASPSASSMARLPPGSSTSSPIPNPHTDGAALEKSEPTGDACRIPRTSSARPSKLTSENRSSKSSLRTAPIQSRKHVGLTNDPDRQRAPQGLVNPTGIPPLSNLTFNTQSFTAGQVSFFVFEPPLMSLD
ncbi:hypothetical protein PGTUg99_003629 [Puccinia graminis f. sp. tritici]|uniref:Uncharacterized protein n=1 Tax=Puccinia graminis f. sp. tritici TaxID=56615 RepID=A0A5B0S603_PUCGR|nr:hypothetical protein PGTUg99_003629 [Puccinia graminis f. sp. tritici]